MQTFDQHSNNQHLLPHNNASQHSFTQNNSNQHSPVQNNPAQYGSEEAQVQSSTAAYRYQTPAWLDAGVSPCNVVLEGGAMRAQFTAGVLDFWMEQKFFPRVVVGTSAGALTGSCYAAGLYGRSCFLNVKYCNDARYLSMRSFALTGNVYGREFAFDAIPHKLDPLDPAAYNDSPVKLVAVSSNLETGEADYHEIVDYEADLPYIIASSSMPLLSKIVEIDGKKLLDGGPCDSVALDYSRSLGEKKHIVILTQDPTYQKQPNKLMTLMRNVYRNYPYFCERVEYRHYEYNRLYRRLKREANEGSIFVIQPQKPLEVGHMERDANKLLDLYTQGYEQGMKTWNALQTYLKTC